MLIVDPEQGSSQYYVLKLIFSFEQILYILKFQIDALYGCTGFVCTFKLISHGSSKSDLTPMVYFKKGGTVRYQ